MLTLGQIGATHATSSPPPLHDCFILWYRFSFYFLLFAIWSTLVISSLGAVLCFICFHNSFWLYAVFLLLPNMYFVSHSSSFHFEPKPEPWSWFMIFICICCFQCTISTFLSLQIVYFMQSSLFCVSQLVPLFRHSAFNNALFDLFMTG
jgi:hypothetical protein